MALPVPAPSPCRCHVQGCKCQSGYWYSRTGGQPPKCTRIPPIRWQIWAPCIVVLAALLAAVLRYFWGMLRANAGALYAVNTKLEPPGEPAGLGFRVQGSGFSPLACPGQVWVVQQQHAPNRR